MVSRFKSTVLIVGRLSGPKNSVILKILRDVAPPVLGQVRGVRFQIVGGPVTEEHREIEKQNPSIHFEGHQKNLKPFYQKATLVIGAGRVALEAMSLRKPVVAIGERVYIGPLLPEKIEQAKATNFGDCWESEVFDWAQMSRDLVDLLRQKNLREKTARTGHELVYQEYDMAKIFPRMEDLYQQVLLRRNVDSVHELPVLMYHQVVGQAPPISKFNLHVIQADLERQFQYLQKRGFETITFGDLLTRKIPRKPVILTFDDGYENNYRFLFPLLKKYGMKAVIYILGNRKHRTNFWDVPQGEAEHRLLQPGQIREMSRSGLVEFGAHSMNHTKLTEVGPREAEKEVAGCKKALEDFLGKRVLSFAYPYGFLDEEIKKTTAAAGYTFGIGVNNGPTRFGEDLMEIRRVHLFPKTSSFEYFKKTSGFYLRYRAWGRKLRGR